MDDSMPRRRTVRYRKRSDLISEDIKRWIVKDKMQPGAKLPQERELLRHFKASKGTIREVLKSLEVQGLVTISTGPGGGATLVDVPERNAMQLLANYFYFKSLTIRDIYAVRKLVEPALAVSALDGLRQEHLAALERIIEGTTGSARTLSQRRDRRIAELQFHDILADACPNVLLGFMCRFINGLLRDLVVFNKIYRPSRDDFQRSNLDYHRALLDALKARDRDRLLDLMRRHMQDAEQHMIRLQAEVERNFIHD